MLSALENKFGCVSQACRGQINQGLLMSHSHNDLAFMELFSISASLGKE
jgi:hypothetical protein